VRPSVVASLSAQPVYIAAIVFYPAGPAFRPSPSPLLVAEFYLSILLFIVARRNRTIFKSLLLLLKFSPRPTR